MSATQQSGCTIPSQRLLVSWDFWPYLLRVQEAQHHMQGLDGHYNPRMGVAPNSRYRKLWAPNSKPFFSLFNTIHFG